MKCYLDMNHPFLRTLLGLSCLYLVLQWSACKNVKVMDVERTTPLGDTEYYSVLKKDTAKKEGLYVLMSSMGDTLEKAMYTNGQLNGNRYLFKNGKVFIIETYLEGAYHGPYTAFFNDGQLKQKGFYKNNQMDSIWTTYYTEKPDQIKEEVTFHNGTENGPFREYHLNGKLAAEGNYVEEFEDGEIKVYDTTGTLKKIYVYKDKRPVQTINVP